MSNVTQLKLVEPPPKRRARPKIGYEIVERFMGGEWFSPEMVAEAIGADVQHARDTLDNMHKRSTYGVTCERQRVGRFYHYRLFKAGKAVNVEQLVAKLKPIAAGMAAEGRKSIVTMSPPTVAHLAHLLAKLIDELSGK